MRKRIGTKLYDTDTSEFICDMNEGKLYRKMTRGREWFLLTNDGMIIPLDPDDNRVEVGKQHVKEEPQNAYTTIWVDRDTHSKLSAAAKKFGCSVSEVVRKLVKHIVLLLKL